MMMVIVCVFETVCKHSISRISEWTDIIFGVNHVDYKKSFLHDFFRCTSKLRRVQQLIERENIVKIIPEENKF